MDDADPIGGAPSLAAAADGPGSPVGGGTVRSRAWSDGRVVADNFALDDLDTWLGREGVLVWLDLTSPDHAVLQRLAAEVGLDPRAVEDALAAGERTKYTRHAGHAFLTVYATRLVQDGATHRSRLETAEVSAFVLPRGLITVHEGSFFDIDPVLERWEEDAELLVGGPSTLLHGLLDEIVDGHFETVQDMDESIEALEDLMFVDSVPVQEIQRHLFRVRKELVQVRRIVLPMREVVNGVIRVRATEPEAPGAAVMDGWYADLYDHVLRVTEWTESLRDMVTTLFETNLSLQDARLNIVMKKLAGWAAIIAVPTAVTGWFGQNIPYPGFQASSGLWLSAALIAIGTGGLYVLFRRFDWI